MIVEKAFLDKLKEFGLNSYESKLWTALLSRGTSTAGELADISGVPRSRSYDVLESLSHKGFISVKGTKPIKYLAVAPKEVLDVVKQKISEQHKDDIRQIDSLKSGNVISELDVLFSQGVEQIDAMDMTGSIKGRENHEHHLNSMIRTAKKSVNIFTTEAGLLRKGDKLFESLSQAKKNGAKIRIAAPLTKDTKDIVKSLSEIAEVKHSCDPARFVVVDDKESFLMLLDDKAVHKDFDTALWLNSKYFSSALSSMFNQTWKSLPCKKQ
jgi:sugar-specific transcriptional regulator TrmB